MKKFYVGRAVVNELGERGEVVFAGDSVVLVRFSFGTKLYGLDGSSFLASESYVKPDTER